MSSRTFRCGQPVPASGIYRVEHSEHRPPHEVTLIKGFNFPPCARCGELVRFTTVRLIHDLDSRREKIVLHYIPDLDHAA